MVFQDMKLPFNALNTYEHNLELRNPYEELNSTATHISMYSSN